MKQRDLFIELSKLQKGYMIGYSWPFNYFDLIALSFEDIRPFAHWAIWSEVRWDGDGYDDE